MNNNFKKLLASAMALAMVTSVMPMGVSAARETVGTCDAPNLSESYVKSTLALNSYKAINWEKVNSDSKIAENTIRLNDGSGFVAKGTNVFEFFTSGEGRRVVNWFAEDEHALNCATTIAEFTENQTYAKKILNIIDGTNALINKIRDEKAFIASVDENTSIDTLIDAYDEVTDASTYSYLAFKENLTDEQKSDLDAVIEELTILLDGADYTGTSLNAYVKSLKEGLKNFVDGKDALDGGYITKSDVDTQIKEIKSTRDYKKYSKNDAVIAIIEEYEAMYDEIKEVNDAVNAVKNDAYKAYVKGTESVEDRVKKHNTLVELVYGLSTSDFEVLNTFKKEVLDVIYTMEKGEIGGYTFDDSKKSYFVSSTTLNKIKGLLNSHIFDYDEKDNMFGWDYLEAHMTEIKEAQETIEKLGKLDSISLTVSDKDLLLEIDDAVYFLRTDAASNLTYAEEKAAKQAERKVDELLEAYRVKFGSVTTTGWVDMGNGNWKYYEEDGTAPTKWICTAKDTWYYVQNGVMLRNAWVWRDNASAYYVGNDGKMVYGPTTVNGYELDANGLWHK